ncbi:MAG TPA: FimD/PapC N-terminal domain-containing protein, partial [Puia sp.]|nr:FimD/PapC N-terminal domain-containing protein [Puia sp.]
MKTITPKQLFILSPLCFVLFSVLPVQAEDYFNPALLSLGDPEQGVTDLSVFESAGSQMPGVYRVNVYLNNRNVSIRDIEFTKVTDASGQDVLQPCLTAEDLAEWGVRTSQFPELVREGSTCAYLEAIPHAAAEFQFSQLRLNLSVPQAALVPEVRGYVPPESWSQGINALLL